MEKLRSVFSIGLFVFLVALVGYLSVNLVFALVEKFA